MSAFDEIRGHARPIKVIRRALSSNRVAHAYLFWGPDGVGKEKTARAVAAALLCADAEALKNAVPCGHCPACAKMSAGAHPDLHLLAAAPGEKSIPIDDVRRFQEALAFRAYERGRKVAIIRDGFRLTTGAANALLKTVEEPPEDTFLILTAHHPSQLLPTLVSRCQALRFDALAEADVMAILTGAGLEPQTAARLSAISGGSPGIALSMEPSMVEDIDAEAEMLARGLKTLSVAERFALAEKWSKEERENLALLFGCLERRLIREAEAGGDWALGFLDTLGDARWWLERNVNTQLALDALFVLGAGNVKTPYRL